jgi:hypothetical protein
MEWQIVVAIAIAVPVILFPAAFVWYLNMGGIVAALKEARAKRAVQKKDAAVKVTAKKTYD